MGKRDKSERKTYLDRLLSERVTNVPCKDGYYGDAMKRGNELEPRARARHGLEIGEAVKEVGFISCGCDWDGWVGASTDGLIGDDGIVEIKCVNNPVQIRTILEGKVPGSHKYQIQGGLLVTEREFCDFVSFNPDLGFKYEYFSIRVYRDEEVISELFEGLNVFIDELRTLQNSFGSVSKQLNDSIKGEASKCRKI